PPFNTTTMATAERFASATPKALRKRLTMTYMAGERQHSIRETIRLLTPTQRAAIFHRSNTPIVLAKAAYGTSLRVRCNCCYPKRMRVISSTHTTIWSQRAFLVRVNVTNTETSGELTHERPTDTTRKASRYT